MHTVICAFDDRADAQRAMERLIERGFTRDMVHLESGRKGGAHVTGARTDDADEGFLESIGSFFSDLFSSTDDQVGEAGNYSEAVRRGSSVLVVDATDQQEADRAEQIMSEMGGSVDMDERTALWRSEGWTGYGSGAGTGRADNLTDDDAFARTDTNTRLATDTGMMPGTDTNTRMDLDDDTSAGRTRPAAAFGSGKDTRESVLPVVQEELEVGKREVQRGGVRVFQRVSETPVRELVRLREERAVVERRPVDRAATSADLSSFKDGSIEIRETSEEAVVSKTARVVEEVVVGKDVEERTEEVEDTVRRTDVEVEQLSGNDADRRSDRASGADPLRQPTPDDELTSRTR